MVIIRGPGYALVKNRFCKCWLPTVRQPDHGRREVSIQGVRSALAAPVRPPTSCWPGSRHGPATRTADTPANGP